MLPITKGAAAGQILQPQGVSVDAAGNIWVADTGNNRIEQFTRAGVFADQMIGSYGCYFTPQQPVQCTTGARVRQHRRVVCRRREQQPHPGLHALGHVIRVPNAPPVISATPVFQRDIFNAGGIAPMYPAGGGTDASGTMWIADFGCSRIDKILRRRPSPWTPTSGAASNAPRNLSLDVTTPSDLWITDTGTTASWR